MQGRRLPERKIWIVIEEMRITEFRTFNDLISCCWIISLKVCSSFWDCLFWILQNICTLKTNMKDTIISHLKQGQLYLIWYILYYFGIYFETIGRSQIITPLHGFGKSLKVWCTSEKRFSDRGLQNCSNASNG